MSQEYFFPTNRLQNLHGDFAQTSASQLILARRDIHVEVAVSPVRDVPLVVQRCGRCPSQVAFQGKPKVLANRIPTALPPRELTYPSLGNISQLGKFGKSSTQKVPLKWDMCSFPGG